MKKKVTNTCIPPRQREGKAYPGGKTLRKAHERLAVRRQNFTNKSEHRMPGSMTK